MSLFDCPPVFDVVNKRKVKFLSDYVQSGNTLCMLFAGTAQNELHSLLKPTVEQLAVMLLLFNLFSFFVCFCFNCHVSW